MSQHDLSIANQGFPAFRSDLNDALQALGSLSSGATAPSTTYANMLWYDTANNIIKVRNEDNDAWISLFTLDQSTDAVSSITATTVNGTTVAAGTLTSSGNTTLGDASGDSVTINASTVSTPNGLNFDSNTLVIDATNNIVGVGLSPANNNNPFQAAKNASGNIASLSIKNSDTSSDYSHAGILMEAKNGATYGAIFADKANSQLRLGYNTTGATLGVDSSGNIASFGGQIKFPASQNASSDANTLDDYEEGSWTGGFSDGTNSVSFTGNYVKVGRICTIRFSSYQVNISSLTGGGYLRINGLPFSSSAEHFFANGGIWTNISGLNFFASISGDNLIYWKSDNITDVGYVYRSTFSNTTLFSVYGSYTYLTAS